MPSSICSDCLKYELPRVGAGGRGGAARRPSPAGAAEAGVCAAAAGPGPLCRRARPRPAGVAALCASLHHLSGAAPTTATCRRLVHTASPSHQRLMHFSACRLKTVFVECAVIAFLPCFPPRQAAARSCRGACQLQCSTVSVRRMQQSVSHVCRPPWRRRWLYIRTGTGVHSCRHWPQPSSPSAPATGAGPHRPLPLSFPSGTSSGGMPRKGPRRPTAPPSRSSLSHDAAFGGAQRALPWRRILVMASMLAHKARLPSLQGSGRGLKPHGWQARSPRRWDLDVKARSGCGSSIWM